MNGNKGFSLVEMMVAVGLSSIVFLAAVGLFKVVNRDTDLSVNILDTAINNLEAETIVKKDLILAKHSFNRLLVVDDQKKYFFDYLMEQSCPDQCQRTVTLELPKGEGEISRPMYFLTTHPISNNATFYYPGTAFDDVGDLEFISLNKKGILSNDPHGPWRKGSLLLLYSSTQLNDLNGDLSFATISPSFLGWVMNDRDGGILKPEVLRGLYRSETLYNGKREVNNDEEAFLRRLPYTAGLGNYLLIENVRIVRYQLIAEKKKGNILGRLHRAVLNSDGSWTDRPIAFGLNKVIFARTSIDSPAISIDMIKTTATKL